MEKIKPQVTDRVNSDFLGDGEVVDIIKGTSKGVFAYMVLFDTAPPIEYNNGNNPCLMFEGGIKIAANEKI